MSEPQGLTKLREWMHEQGWYKRQLPQAIARRNKEHAMERASREVSGVGSLKTISDVIQSNGKDVKPAQEDEW